MTAISPPTSVMGSTSAPFSWSNCFTFSLWIKACGSLLRLWRFTSMPIFFKASMSVAIRSKFLSTLGPQTPVEQHMAGSKISISFIVCFIICLILQYLSHLSRCGHLPIEHNFTINNDGRHRHDVIFQYLCDIGDVFYGGVNMVILDNLLDGVVSLLTTATAGS
jgi:hypothetical protein